MLISWNKIYRNFLLLLFGFYSLAPLCCIIWKLISFQAPRAIVHRHYLSFERKPQGLPDIWGIPKRGSTESAWTIFVSSPHTCKLTIDFKHNFLSHSTQVSTRINALSIFKTSENQNLRSLNLFWNLDLYKHRKISVW